MSPNSAGYSGTPLARKLGIREGTRLRVESPPQNYEKLLAPIPAGVTIQSRVGPTTDVVHLFSTSKSRLAGSLKRARSRLRPDAAIWVSWPKKASKAPTDITEDTIRELAFSLGMVDIKVCAVDEVWSGLKLVIRKENR